MSKLERKLNDLVNFINTEELEEKIGEETIDKLMAQVGSIVMCANSSSRDEIIEALKIFHNYVMRGAKRSGDPLLITLAQLVLNMPIGGNYED